LVDIEADSVLDTNTDFLTNAVLLYYEMVLIFCRALDHGEEECAEQPLLPEETQQRADKDRVSKALHAPAVSQPMPLHLPIITIPILITLSDFIGALAAGKLLCNPSPCQSINQSITFLVWDSSGESTDIY